MIRKFILPLLAIVGVLFAIWTVINGAKAIPPAPPVAEPAHAQFSSYVAGAGIVEPATENIGIAPAVQGVVTQVFVMPGAEVNAGDPLFKIDDRDLQADLLNKKAALKSAEEKLTRLQNLPRPEDIPRAEASVKAAEAQLADAESQYKLASEMADVRAMSREEITRRRYAMETDQAKLAEAKADLALLKAGSWKPDIDIARADIAMAQAAVNSVQTEIERRMTRSPIRGQVLQVKVRAGEYATAGALAQPLILLGRVEPLHVRVDVDENDAWRIRPDAEAEAFVRGNRDIHTALKFVRVEPYVIPKRSLTGDSTERVDTRVLQVLYSFDRGNLPVYVGQQMDVFIQAPPVHATTQPAIAQRQVSQ